MTKTLDQAVALVKTAVDLDSRKNYKEAAKSYREAIQIFHRVIELPSASQRLKEVIESKVGQYEVRLKNLDEHIISQTDLTKFFKDIHRCKADEKPALRATKDKRSHHNNPVLAKSLDLIRKGIREDEEGHYGKALACYEMGLSNMMDVLDSGMLPQEQVKIAETKYKVYHERKNQIEGHLTGIGGKPFANMTKSTEDNHTVKHLEQNESELSNRFQESFESHQETHEIASDEQVQRCASRSMYSLKEPHEMTRIPTKMSISTSLHSLYPTCEIRDLPNDSTFKSSMSTHSSFINIGNDFGFSSLSIKESSLSADHNKESDRDKDETKSQSSDSGYSDESPEDTDSRDSRSVEISDDEDEKIPFVNNIETNVIIVNEITGIEQDEINAHCSYNKFDRQKSLFQNPTRDILISHESQDNLLVLEQEETDFVVAREPRTSQSSVRSLEKPAPEIYQKRTQGTREIIPPRSTADVRGEHENMNKGCYYLMAALDFCWCL